MPTIPSAIHPDCREFVAVVEELLKRRQNEADQTIASYSSWKNDELGPRTWTRTEFEDMVYSSYKPMRQGRVTRPPRREIVMDIADYLNYSLEERNRLCLCIKMRRSRNSKRSRRGFRSSAWLPTRQRS